jgi:hypothetical protein
VCGALERTSYLHAGIIRVAEEGSGEGFGDPVHTGAASSRYWREIPPSSLIASASPASVGPVDEQVALLAFEQEGADFERRRERHRFGR